MSAFDLVREYRTDPDNARLTFTGHIVRVKVTTAKTAGRRVEWKLVYRDPPVEPVLVFEFAEPTHFKAPGWIEGVCRGRVDDGKDHGSKEHTFQVVVTESRVVPEVEP